MAEKLGIKETSEAFSGAMALTRKILEIKKEGVAGLPKLASLYGDLTAAIQGAGQIDDEVKDLDAAEIEALAKLAIIEAGKTLEAAGIKGVSAYLNLAAKSIDAGRLTYQTWLPIIEEVQAARKAQ